MEREEERQRAQQVKVLKFSSFDDSNSVRMIERDSGSELAEKPKAQEQELEPQQPGNYVLRENPKKTKRFVDSKERKVCKECGKGFQSLKALCGHMACHSDKEKVSNNKFKEDKIVMDGHSDTESSGPKLRRVSKRIRYKSLGGSGIEQEQEEVAISLMLLSRDCGHKGGLNSVAESSSNNSIVLEAKSSSIDMIICAKKVTGFDEEVVVAKKDEKLKSDGKISGSENSDSGYFRNGPKKIESDVSVDGFLRNGEFKKLEVESGSGFGAGKVGASVDKSELGKNSVEEEGKDQEKRCSSKYELRKRTRSGISKTEALLRYFKNEADYASNGEICRNSQKRSKYECLTCSKTFHSHTALGGHRASHAKTNGCVESIYESGENSIETHDNSDKLTQENGPGKARTNGVFTGNADRKLGPKKSKGHECPICFRMFKSGQALGGHKRSHFVGGREANSTTLTRQEPAPEAEIAVLFDLNLPAPIEDEADGDVGLMTW